jgi:hypothetical protein
MLTRRQRIGQALNKLLEEVKLALNNYGMHDIGPMGEHWQYSCPGCRIKKAQEKYEECYRREERNIL